MSREIMQQALEALEGIHVGNMTPMAEENWNEALIALRQALAQPEQAVVSFPSFMRKRIEQAMKDAIYPTGMSVHDGKVKVLVSDLHRMLLVIDSAPPKRQWVGLTFEEIKDIWINTWKVTGATDAFAYAIESALRKKNNVV